MADSTDLVVRTATVADLEEIMDLAIAAAEENGVLKANPQKLLADIWPALHQDHGICAVIGKPDGIIEGVILLRIGTLWYSDESCIEEKAIFIHKDYRSAKGGRANQLCKFSKKLSDELGLPLMIGVLSSDRTEGKIRMYRREF